MSYALSYASVAYQKVTTVRFRTIDLARHWFRQVEKWSDVARVVATGPDGRTLADTTIDARITTDADREIVARMDDEGRVFPWPPPTAPDAAARGTFGTHNDERCRCAHGRAQHAGADGAGRCASEGCQCRKFWRKA